MKNKELTRLLCISVVSALVVCTPATITAESTEPIESASEEVTPAPEPEPTVVPDTPTPEPEPTVVPDTPTPEPEPEPTVVPDTPAPEPEPEPTVVPDTPTPTPESSEPEPTAAPETPTPTPESSEPEPTVAPETPTPTPEPVPQEEPEKIENTGDPDNPEVPGDQGTPDEADLTDKEVSAAADVVKQIDALANKQLTVDDKSAVEAVRKKYDSLSDSAKKLVSNYKKLVSMEATIKKLEEEVLAKVGEPVFYKDTASIHHAGKEFYLKSLKENYHLSFSDDIRNILDEIEKEYLEENGVDAADPKEKTLLRVRNWQDVLAVYVYQQSKDGQDTFVIDKNAKDSLKEIFAELNPLIHDPEDEKLVTYANDHIEDYIKAHKISLKDQKILNKYLETDCKLLCATVTAYPGFVRESVGDGISEERVQVIAAAFSAIGKVGYFWGGKYGQIGENPEWGTFKKVEAAGSRTTGMLRAYGLDCSGFVSWAVVNGYKDTGMYNSIGEGTTDQWEKAGSVRIEDVQPGDLVFKDGPVAAEQNHVGIVVGKTDSGDLVVVHCSAGQNGVTVGDAYGAGFRYVRQAAFYPTAEELKKEQIDTSQWVSDDTEAVDADEPEQPDVTKDPSEDTSAPDLKTEEPETEKETVRKEPSEEETGDNQQEPSEDQTEDNQDEPSKNQTEENTEESSKDQTEDNQEGPSKDQTEDHAEESSKDQTDDNQEESSEEQAGDDQQYSSEEQTEDNQNESPVNQTENTGESLTEEQPENPEEPSLEELVDEPAEEDPEESVEEQPENPEESLQELTLELSDEQPEDFSEETVELSDGVLAKLWQLSQPLDEYTDDSYQIEVIARAKTLKNAEDAPEDKKEAAKLVDKVQEEEAEEESFDGDGALPKDVLEKLLQLNQSDLLRENLEDVYTASSLSRLQKYNGSDLRN